MTVVNGLLKSTTFHSLVIAIGPQVPAIVAALLGTSIAPNTMNAILTLIGSLGVILGRVNAAGPLTGTPKA